MTDFEKDGERIASVLDDSVPSEVAERLTASRRQAVELAARRSSRSQIATWLPAGGAVAAGVLAVVLLQEQGTQPMPTLNAMEMEAVNDIELLDDLAMLAWLEEQSTDAG